MRTIVAGGRTYHLSESDYWLLDCMMSPSITEVVCGAAKGADTGGRQWAISRGVPVKMFPPDWDKYGKGAGFRRNREMAEYADRLVAFWDGESRGTKHMIETAGELGLIVIVCRIPK